MYECPHCEAEFEIEYSGKEPVEFCPFCGEELEVDYEDSDEIEIFDEE